MLTAYINSHSKNTKIKTKITNFEVWSTILVIYYFRLICVDHRYEWKDSYLKAYRWLWGQFKREEQIEDETFNIIKLFVKERYSVKEDVLELDNRFITSISDKVDFIKKDSN